MATTSCTSILPVPLETVWATLARFEDMAQWGRGVTQSSLLSEASSGIGAVRRVQVGRAALRETVTVWEPLQVLGYTIEGLPAIVRAAANTWTLAAHGTSTGTSTGTGTGTGTRVTLSGEVETKAGPLLDKVVARKIGSANVELLAGLEDYLRAAERA